MSNSLLLFYIYVLPYIGICLVVQARAIIDWNEHVGMERQYRGFPLFRSPERVEDEDGRAFRLKALAIIMKPLLVWLLGFVVLILLTTIHRVLVRE